MKIIRPVFLLVVIVGLCYGWYYWYSSAVKQEAVARKAYAEAVRIQKSKPPAKVQVIQVPATDYPDGNLTPGSEK